jgi:hypothetical protein
MMWPWAKSRKAEERDRQEQQEPQEERNETAGELSRRLLPDPPRPKDDNKDSSQWVQQSPGPAAACAPAPGNDPPAAGTDPGGAVVTDAIRVVLIDISGPGSEAGQPVRLTIKRREALVAPAEGETPYELARKAEGRLGEEMEDTVAAATGEKIADRILPAQGPAAAAAVADLKSDLHSIMLGQLVPPLAQYVPLPGIDRLLDTAEVAILVGGIVLGTVMANPALYSVCVKSLAHETIANAAEEVIKDAIEAALSDYARPLPPVWVIIPEGPGPVIPNLPPSNEPDVSPDGPGDGSPGKPGMRAFLQGLASCSGSAKKEDQS